MKKVYFLLIKDKNDIHISSYTDEVLARRYMFKDICTCLSEGKIDHCNLNENMDHYKNGNIEWKIMSGYHIDGIYNQND